QDQLQRTRAGIGAERRTRLVDQHLMIAAGHVDGEAVTHAALNTDGFHDHSLLAGALQERLQVFLQVLMPSSGYAGQKRNSPVTSGSTPIQPHQPITPNRLRAMSNTPMAMRSVRSRVPTLIFIATSRS